MTVDKFDNVWANSGDTGTDPTDEKKGQGFVRGDKPTWQRANFLQNRVEAKMNETIREGTSTLYDASTDHKFMVASGLFTESWGSCGDAQNFILQGIKRFSVLVTNIDTNGQPFIITCDTVAQKFERWNSRTLTIQTLSDVFTDDLPAGTFEIHSLCTDNVNIFGLFRETGANTWHVQSWSATDLAVNPAWTATGTLLPGTGAIAVTDDNSPEIIIANSTKIATGNAWNTITSSSSAAITVIDLAAGSIDASGAGDAPTGDSVECGRGLASDGEYVFFNGTGATNEKLCSARISNLTTGSGGAGMPLTVSTAITSLTNMGETLFCSHIATGTTATDTVGFIFDRDYSKHQSIPLGTDSTGAVPISTMISNIDKAVFDGLNLWLLGYNSANLSVVMKVDTGKFWRHDISILADETAIPDMMEGPYPLEPDQASVHRDYKGAMCFDGRDIWSIVNEGTDGKIIRIPLSSLRG